jgi:pantoate--beta-alanine ligase
MRVVKDIEEMQGIAASAREDAEKIVFVPTMGYLHEGHMGLLKKGRDIGGLLVMSIFVNPMQFGPAEDYMTYPSNIETDIKQAEKAGVDIIFHPDKDEIYPEGYQTFIEIRRLQRNLCGLLRPGHFIGVATVLLKLFNIIRPHAAILGEKDYQQFVLIKRMVSDLNLGIDLLSSPIVREHDGLAASSRNSYLMPKERKSATSIYKALCKGHELFEDGERESRHIIEGVRGILEKERLISVEYVKVCALDTLEDIYNIERKALLAIAVKIGRVRLIDNFVLGT